MTNYRLGSAESLQRITIPLVRLLLYHASLKVICFLGKPVIRYTRGTLPQIKYKDILPPRTLSTVFLGNFIENLGFCVFFLFLPIQANFYSPFGSVTLFLLAADQRTKSNNLKGGHFFPV